MNKEEMINKIRGVKTMPNLDALRLETVTCMKEVGQDGFREIQKEFVKVKNRLLRTPLSQRNW